MADTPTPNRKVETLQSILDAAEVEFSNAGFSGAGMKAIALRAGLSQGLLHYHFGNKGALYEAVVRRRSQIINSQRTAELDAVDLTGPKALEGVIRALVRPPLGPDGGGQAYARIFAGLIVGHERDRALVQENYDPIAQRFVAAIADAGDLPRQVAGMGYVMTLGTLISVIARDGRPERLMGRKGAASTEELVSWIAAFAGGGIEALRPKRLTGAA